MRKTSLLVLFLSITSFSLAQELLVLGNNSSLTVNPGAVVTVSGGIKALTGSSLILNGDIYLTNSTAGNTAWTDQTSLGVIASGTGTVNFLNNGGHTVSGLTKFPSLIVNTTGNIALNNDLVISNVLVLKQGKIVTGSNKVIISNSAANALLGDIGNPYFSKGYVLGKLRRSITSSATPYDFPVGDVNAGGKWLQFINSVSTPVTGITYLDATLTDKAGTDAGLNVTENSIPYTSVNSTAVWHLVPDASPTGGNYALKLYTQSSLPVFTTLADNKFGILVRPDASSAGVDWQVPTGSVLNPANGLGRKVSDSFAYRKQISSFGQFGIGQTALDLLRKATVLSIISQPAIKTPGNNQVVNIWPNPSPALVNISTDFTLPTDALIADGQGNIVKQLKLVNKNTRVYLPVAGEYYLIIPNQKGYITRKIIIAH